MFSYYLTVVLVDAVLGNHTPYAGRGIDIAVSAHHRTGVENAVASHLNVVAQHGAELLDAGPDAALWGMDDDQTPVLFPLPQEFMDSNTGRPLTQNPGY